MTIQRKLIFASLLAITGCMIPAHDDVQNSDYPQPTGVEISNPMLVPANDREFTWNTIVDTIDDYFDIAHEQRVQLIGEVLTEGTIITQMQPGATVFEQWRNDSTSGFERWQSTFQSIRRKAIVRVSPGIEHYRVHVEVYKELEDLDRPERSAVGRQLRRHDGSLIGTTEFSPFGPRHLGWIPIGRDVSLEQTILADLHQRFYNLHEQPDVQLLPSAEHLP